MLRAVCAQVRVREVRSAHAVPAYRIACPEVFMHRRRLLCADYLYAVLGALHWDVVAKSFAN
jgi:hypothetical protein